MIHSFEGKCSECRQWFQAVSVKDFGKEPKCIECEYGLSHGLKKDGSHVCRHESSRGPQGDGCRRVS